LRAEPAATGAERSHVPRESISGVERSDKNKRPTGFPAKTLARRTGGSVLVVSCQVLQLLRLEAAAWKRLPRGPCRPFESGSVVSSYPGLTHPSSPKSGLLGTPDAPGLQCPALGAGLRSVSRPLKGTSPLLHLFPPLKTAGYYQTSRSAGLNPARFRSSRFANAHRERR
jgi:hypothetical protein